jgi:hypothetical protein
LYQKNSPSFFLAQAKQQKNKRVQLEWNSFFLSLAKYVLGSKIKKIEEVFDLFRKNFLPL